MFDGAQNGILGTFSAKSVSRMLSVCFWMKCMQTCY